MLKIIADVHKLIDGVSGIAAAEIGESTDVSEEEFQRYRTALLGIFNVIVVSLGYLLFVDYLSGIHPAISATVLLLIVIWAVVILWKVVQAISSEIRRYTVKWSEEAISAISEGETE